jgi:hypothetical protein
MDMDVKVQPVNHQGLIFYNSHHKLIATAHQVDEHSLWIEILNRPITRMLMAAAYVH